MATYYLGKDCHLFYGSAGSSATTELTDTKDVTLNMTAGDADVTTRATGGWVAHKATTKDATLEFSMNYNPTDSGFAAIGSAFMNGTAIGMFVCVESSSSGTKGLVADFNVTGFNVEQPLDGAQSVSVTLNINCESRNPVITL